MANGLTRGQRNCQWIEDYCRIPEGKFVGQPVRLREWQRRDICRIYDNPSGTRRAILSFGRKNAKTTLAALLLLLHLVGPEARPNSQLNSAAQSKDQAAVLFALAAKVVRLGDLREFVVIRENVKHLYCPALGTIYKALSKEASTAYGLSPVFVVHDELGQVRGPRDELFEALETAAGAHEEPLSVIISTQAPTDGALLSILIDDAKTGADPKVVLSLYSAPDDLDPFSDEAIRAANPAYGDFLNAEEVRNQAENARRMPSRESIYRNLVLNQRVHQHASFVSRSVWALNGEAPNPAALSLGRVYVGLDLSARNDLTAGVAIVQAVEPGTDRPPEWHVFAKFFAPSHGLIERAQRDRAPYDVWAAEGHLVLTPGASVGYDAVADWLCSLCDDFDVAAIAYDRWRIDVLKAELARRGRELPLVPFGQGYKDMSPAIDSLEADLISGTMRHGNHPVLTWNTANATTLRDPAGNRKLDKTTETGRIDGTVALAMAKGIAAREATAPSSFVVPADYEVMVI